MRYNTKGDLAFIEFLLSMTLLLVLIFGIYFCGLILNQKTHHERFVWFSDLKRMHGKTFKPIDPHQSHLSIEKPSLLAFSNTQVSPQKLPIAFSTRLAVEMEKKIEHRSEVKGLLPQNHSWIASFNETQSFISQTLLKTYSSTSGLLLSDFNGTGYTNQGYKELLWGEALLQTGHAKEISLRFLGADILEQLIF